MNSVLQTINEALVHKKFFGLSALVHCVSKIMLGVMNQERHLCFCIWHSCSPRISVIVELSSENRVCLFWKNSILRSDNAILFYFNLCFLGSCQDDAWTYRSYRFWMLFFVCLFFAVQSCMELQFLWPNIKMLQKSGKLYQWFNYRNFLCLIKINTWCLWILNRVTVLKSMKCI